MVQWKQNILLLRKIATISNSLIRSSTIWPFNSFSQRKLYVILFIDLWTSTSRIGRLKNVRGSLFMLKNDWLSDQFINKNKHSEEIKELGSYATWICNEKSVYKVAYNQATCDFSKLYSTYHHHKDLVIKKSKFTI